MSSFLEDTFCAPVFLFLFFLCVLSEGDCAFPWFSNEVVVLPVWKMDFAIKNFLQFVCFILFLLSFQSLCVEKNET